MKKEDFFGWVRAVYEYAKGKCSECGAEITTEGWSNCAFRRIHNISLCDKCYEKREEIEDRLFEEITKTLKQQEQALRDATVRVAIQDCDGMKLREVRKQLAKITGVNYHPLLRENNGYTEGYAEIKVRDSKDFIRQFCSLNKARTKCGCGLFVGDGCNPSAYVVQPKFWQVQFSLLGGEE